MRIAVGSVNKPNEKRLKSGFAPNFVHSYDACLLKTAFLQWDRPLVTIHDCIAVLPNDMDEAHIRIREGLIKICNGDPLNQLANCLGINQKTYKRLPPLNGSLSEVRDSIFIFN